VQKQRDFFLWGFLKERVYSNNPRYLQELKHNTEHNAANTDPDTLRKVARNALKGQMLVFEKAVDIFSIRKAFL
jgi:hypothetical protein